MSGVCGQGSIRNKRCDECICRPKEVKAAKEVAKEVARSVKVAQGRK